MDHDWDESVSLRLAALALDRGRLTDDLVTALAVRGALLVDLALRGRVVDTPEAVEFDSGPSGFAPADRLLSVEIPSLTDLLRRGAVDQRDLAAEHLRRGSWSAAPPRLFRRRYVDHRADRTRADERAPARPDRRWTAPDAALVAIAGALGLLDGGREQPGEALLAATGPVRWLVELVVEEVDRGIVRGQALRGAVT